MSVSKETYTHGHAESVLRAHTSRTVENSASYLAPHLRAGLKVLDVGCGPGTITVDLAKRVAPGPVVGIDAFSEPLERARSSAIAAGLDTVNFAIQNVYRLPFDEDTFDVVHAHQLLQHLGDPVAALKEMLRVCRPEGVVAARDADYAAMTWYPPDSRLDDWLRIYRSIAHGNGAEPDAGRRLLAWARASDAETVTPTASVWCYAGLDQRSAWGSMWADRMTNSAIADQALNGGYASIDELHDIAAAWQDWSRSPDGWFTILHGEILCQPGAFPL